jgi:hypothetical protein
VLLLEDRDPGSSYRSTAVVDDGATLLMTHNAPGGPSIVMLSVDESGDGSRALETLLEDSMDAAISPDGRWVAYRSDTSGRWEVYLRRWHGGGRLGPERRVSTDGAAGDHIWWYTPADGGPLEIWYIDDRKVYSVTVRTEPALTLSRPRPIAEWRPEYRYMETLSDGRLLMSLLGEEEGPFGRINVVRGWTRELERRFEWAGPSP